MNTPASGQLRRDIGLGGAIFLGLGSIVGTGVFVSLGLATDVAGGWVIAAIVLAGLLATCNGLSSAQLAAATPVSGGTYEYGYLHLRPILGFVAGWMFLCAKSASAATAALGFAGYLGRLIGHDSHRLTVGLAVVAVIALMLLILGGIRRSTWLNTAIVLSTLLALMFYIFIAMPIANERLTELASEVPSIMGSVIREGSITTILHATALMFVAYTGYGRIATLGEEVHHPRRTIPRAVIMTLAVSMLLYVLVAIVSIAAVGSDLFAAATLATAAPLEFVAERSALSWAATVVVIGAMTAMLGVLLNLILGLSRVLLAMGRRGDMPTMLAHIESKHASPSVAIVVMSAIVAGLALLGDIKLAWSFSALTVLVYYAITNLAALRLPREQQLFNPIIAWCGLAGCLGLTVFIDVRTWLIGGAVMAVGLTWFAAARRLRNPDM